MKIIILGAGQVGGSLAEHLVGEDNDITLVDCNLTALELLQQRLDIQTIHGYASYPDVLISAGIEHADMLIAVTNSDETNMIACKIAYSLFHTPTKIARLRATHYLKYPELFENQIIPIDVCISPEQLVTETIQRLLDFPGALQVVDFADGRVQLVAVKPYPGGPLVGKSLRQWREMLPSIEMRVAAIYRNNQSIAITDSTAFEVDDEVFFIATPTHIQKILQAMGRSDSPNKRVMIAGGGQIGGRLALALEKNHHVKIIDHNVKRTHVLAETLSKTTVLLGDASDRELLHDENIDAVDAFVALTNDDEANIMSCLQAKRMGVTQVMALINKPHYVDLVDGGMVDVAISPQLATISAILRYIRLGDIVTVHALRRGAAEAIEVIAHGNKASSKVVGRSLKEIKLPHGTVIGALVRDDMVIIAKPSLIIESEDHIILFVMNKDSIPQVEKLFQVNMSFIG